MLAKPRNDPPGHTLGKTHLLYVYTCECGWMSQPELFPKDAFRRWRIHVDECAELDTTYRYTRPAPTNRDKWAALHAASERLDDGGHPVTIWAQTFGPLRRDERGTALRGPVVRDGDVFR